MHNKKPWGNQSVGDEKDTVHVDRFKERLYQLFNKSKDIWDKDDLFLLVAVSDFIRQSVETLMESENKNEYNINQIKNTGELHHVFIVPSEWEDEIREVLIRPLFVQAKLISEDDHEDRLSFCSDAESIYYYLTDNNMCWIYDIKRYVILGRIVMVEESKVSIRLDLISTGNPLFDFPNSLLSPKIVASNSLSLTTNDIKNGIREFIKIKFSFDAQEETVQRIMEEMKDDALKDIVSILAWYKLDDINSSL
ncbi:hypothetical protein HPULCUR_006557 [Helicostylum pulchrum]|uniref:Uncharacterized protein n=1 Tax=Helicostylum pulchrum TaxID=562976 RepID=A0ABP9Y360_9FUNG